VAGGQGRSGTPRGMRAVRPAVGRNNPGLRGSTDSGRL
ncbi:MAG: hypothetical protein AVDCRST_MAG49-533, partial [uncultured Thermomicrobiales bacterium]